jgi:hypothetical protein
MCRPLRLFCDLKKCDENNSGVYKLQLKRINQLCLLILETILTTNVLVCTLDKWVDDRFNYVSGILGV